jgi:O-antigen/teichoic acid export membrane protein
VVVCVLFALLMLAMSFTTPLEWPHYWLAIAGMSLAISGIQTYGFKRNREKRYKHTIYVQVIRAICVIGISAALAFRADGLLWGHVAGYLAGFVACMAIEYRVAGRLVPKFSFRRMVFWLRRNDKFFKLSTPAVFINSFATQVPVFLLAHFSAPGRSAITRSSARR